MSQLSVRVSRTVIGLGVFVVKLSTILSVFIVLDGNPQWLPLLATDVVLLVLSVFMRGQFEQELLD